MENPGNKISKLFDVFLSHNDKDKPDVEHLAHKLRDEAHLKVWLDKWELKPGADWQNRIEVGLKTSRACAIFLGPDGIGKWQEDEIEAARVLHKEEAPHFHIVPVLLPGVKDIPLLIRSKFTWIDFRGGLDDAEVFERLVCGIQGCELPTLAVKPADDICPYKGLQAFEAEDADFFFGREIFVQQILLEHLRHSRFLAVVGPSGSGKSSVVRAGLIPALHADMLPEKKPINILKITPGVRPLEELAVALLPLVALNANRALELPRLVEQLRSDEKALHLAIRSAFATSHLQFATCNLLLIDQFEEAFTLCTDDDQRAAFFGNLVYAATLSDSPLAIVLTMRSDFLGKCAAYSGLNILMSENLVQVPQMNEAELMTTITEPAHKVGLRFDEGLAETILEDVLGTPGDLPLLQHALLALWQRRENDRLLFSAYNKIGGVQDSLTRYADEVFVQLTADQQELSRRIFVRLAALGEGTEDTRRRAAKADLLALGAEVVLLKLTHSRLVTTSYDAISGEETVDVVHEALIRGWPKLRGWLNDDRAFHRFRQKLTESTEEWENHGRDASYLYRGAQLAEAEERLKTYANELTPPEKEFIIAGIKWIQQELEKQRKAARRFRRMAVSLTVVFLITLSLGYWAYHERTLALSHAYSVQVLQNLETDPTLSLETAIRAVETNNNFETVNTLRQAVQNAYEISYLRHYKDGITYIDFKSDSIRIISGRFSKVWELEKWLGATRIWHSELRVIETPTNDGPFKEHEHEVANISKDDKHILVIGSYNIVRVRQVSTGKELVELRGHTEFVRDANFNDDGSRIVTASHDQTARVWETKSGKELLVLRGHAATVNSVSFNSAGSRIVTASRDRTARVWDAESGKQLLVLRGHSDDVNQARFSRDGRLILTVSNDRTARVWETKTGKPVIVLGGHSDNVIIGSFSGDGSRILTASDDHTARVWETTSGRELAVLRGHTDSITHANINEDGTRIITASWLDDTVREWEIKNNFAFQIAHTIEIEKIVTDENFNADGSRVVLVDDYNRAHILETETGKESVILKDTDMRCFRASFNRDGTRVVTACYSGFNVWDAISGKQIFASQIELSAEGAKFTPDGSRIITVDVDHKIDIWDPTTSMKLVRLPQKVNASVNVDSYDNLIIAVCDDDKARVWELTTGKELGVLRGDMGEVTHIGFNNDGSRIVTASSDGIAKIWESATGKELAVLHGHTDAIWHANFSSDGDRIITASSDGTARIWDSTTGKPLIIVKDNPDGVIFARFSLDGTLVLTLSSDPVVKIWNSKNGQLISTLRGHKAYIHSLAFSPDGRITLTASADYTARFYCTYLEDLIKLAKSRLTK